MFLNSEENRLSEYGVRSYTTFFQNRNVLLDFINCFWIIKRFDLIITPAP